MQHNKRWTIAFSSKSYVVVLSKQATLESDEVSTWWYGKI
jgi:hypothetical protein